MRHRNKVNHLGRKTAHRKALLSNLASALILNKRIVTTLTKAKVLRGYVEPIINRSKVDSTHNRRLVFSLLQDKEMIKELFDVIAQKIADRPGGYTRIIKMGFRPGDAAEMAMIELVDFNEVYTKEASETKTKTRRSRSKAKSGDATVKTEPKVKAETTNKSEVTANDVDTTQPVEEIAAPLDHGASNTPDVETVNELEAVQIPNEEANPLPVSEQLPEDATNISNSSESNTAITEDSSQDTSDAKGDDLKVVEGIGPAIEKLLQAKGIMTYEQLSNESADNLRAILEEAGSRYSIHDPGTWPEQATLLKEGRMEEFKKLTDELQGGKRVD